MIATVGSRIREIRQDNELTQLELADRMSVTAPYISQVENDREEPTEMFLKLFSHEFNVPFSFIKEGFYMETKTECAKDKENNGTMKSEHINGIVNILHESVLYKLERNNADYGRYLQLEDEFMAAIENLDISQGKKNYLNDKFYGLAATLDYIMFVAGLRASKEIMDILKDANLDNVRV